jgi:hypothetical protein
VAAKEYIACHQYPFPQLDEQQARQQSLEDAILAAETVIA